MILPFPAGVALPVVRTLADCADYSKTVNPFVDQFYNYPQALLKAGANVENLKALYMSTNPLITGLVISIALAPVFLAVSEATKNYSQVDRCWPWLPSLYNIHYAVWARCNGLPTQRLDNVLAISLIWTTRLTFNYWRKGGYQKGSEDYRWEIVRKQVSPAVMFIFNVTFISLIQSLLLFSVTTPTYVLLLCSRLSGPSMSTVDVVFAGALVAVVLTEFLADQQQWDYHQAKAAYQKSAKVPAGSKYDQKDLERGFNTYGLWRYSRHPNFLAEQTIWLTLYQWSCYETSSLYNWTFVGAMSYVLLFQSSTWLTERITSGKYSEYKIYQQRVGKFVPKLTGSGWDGYVEMQKGAQKKN